jgi:hypothetical protein
MKILTTAALAAMLAATAADAGQLTFYWRSPTTGKIMSNTVSVPPPTDPDLGQPEQPTGFRLTIAGAQSVTRGAIVDLSPIVADGKGPYVYSYFGKLPLGVTFNASTGRFSGPALDAGTFVVQLTVLDTSTGHSAGIAINLIVA